MPCHAPGVPGCDEVGEQARAKGSRSPAQPEVVLDGERHAGQRQGFTGGQAPIDLGRGLQGHYRVEIGKRVELRIEPRHAGAHRLRHFDSRQRACLNLARKRTG
jgi:hypothetical protein